VQRTSLRRHAQRAPAAKPGCSRDGRGRSLEIA
jgi:hypothetical protein